MNPFCLLLITLLGNIVFFFWWTHPENLFKKSCKDPYVLQSVIAFNYRSKHFTLLLFTASNSSTLRHGDSGIVLYHFLNAVARGGGFYTHQIYKRKAFSYLLMCLAKDKYKVSNRHNLLAQKCYSKQFFNLVWPQKDKLTAKCPYCFYFQKSVCPFH